jgi:hypothetical protein
VRRRTFVRFVAVPLVLCLAIGAAWARSYRTMDEWSMASDRGEVRALLIYQGGLHVITGGRRAASRPVSYDEHSIPPGATWGNLYGWGAVEWNFAGFYKVSDLAAARGAPFSLTVVAATYRPTPWLPPPSYQAWVVPMWWLGVAVMLPGARAAYVWWRKGRWVGRGLCPQCRYDLRGTPGHCPECGWARFSSALSGRGPEC